MKNQFQENIVKQWQVALKNEGYDHCVKDKNECSRIKKFSRIWRRILNFIPDDIKSADNKSVFEFGCGGGKHLASFILNGWKVAGIDCSAEVLERAKNYLSEIKKICGCQNNFDLIRGDFLDYGDKEKYDIVFHVGVIEHFLNNDEREKALKTMFDIAKKDGYVVSIVPAGTHPIRQKMKEKRLGGYGISEIDYTLELIENEMRQCGGKNILALSHNIMGYRLIDDKKGFLRLIDLFLYYIFQIIPISFLPKSFAYRHAMTLIGIAQK